MPAGLLLTVPAPWPARDTISGTVVEVKVAVTVGAAEAITVQGPVPVHGPLVQPVNVEFGLGIATRVTAVPLTKLAVQVAPQSISPDVFVTPPVTAPAPVPDLETVSVKVGAKVAVTLVAAASVTVQDAVPLQPPPLQPVKAEPRPGLAVSVTEVPLLKAAAHTAPQSMPAGLLVTAPAPVPALAIVRAKVGAKVAVTLVAAASVTVQEAVPVQPPPLQPVKAEPGPALAVRVTEAPLLKVAAHTAPQVMPAGLLLTVPVPRPAVATVSTKVGVNVAVMVVAPNTVTVHDPVPLQSPPQPVKAEDAFGVAVRVTAVPLTKLAAHVAPQLMPAGLLVTVPEPAPAGETVGAKVAVTPVAAVSVTVQGAVPVQPPPVQPVKAEPSPALAVSVTEVPLLKVAAHTAPQVMPAGLLLT